MYQTDDWPAAPPLAALVNQVHCMDALELLRLLPDASIDLTVTSPPYDNLRKYTGFTWDFEGIARELYRVTKLGGIVVWVVGDATIEGSETLSSFKQAIYFVDTCGFKMHDTMIWQKDGSPFPESNRYAQEYEYMFVLSKARPITTNLLQQTVKYHPGKSATYRQYDGTMTSNKYGTRDTRSLPNVWYISCGYMKTTKDVQSYAHPAMFPEKLAERHILTWSNPGDLVLDPFMGSGTTAKIARNNKRAFIGCDIASDYVAIARARLAQPYTLPMLEICDVG